MIDLRNIKKSFGSKVVLQELSATMEPGKCNLIIGASGSGKTVLMKCIVGLLQPSSGQVLYDGRDYFSMTTEERKEIRKVIGMLFQGSALFDSQTVEQNVIFPLDMFSTDKYAIKRDRVREVLKRVNLSEDAFKKYPAEISGGMKKRVALARAIVLNPKYLFCDEPNSGLDPQTSILIDKLINEITQEYKTTTIMNTHDMNSVMEIGDHIVYMHQGEKEWEGTNKEIIYSENIKLNNFIFASDFLQDAKHMRMIQETGELPKGLDENVRDALEIKLNLDLDKDGQIGPTETNFKTSEDNNPST
ncbi:MAG TPA: ATP-binding cassette domain-containing protein [Niabella sp.]|nr:ATP-binding cassette domain-containing protein [Niabella sp.]HOZ95556.1 ATP-binding cassette domain-containing protein [Niabella sp.]HQW13796.1 ATP-binding cassette domain-containing protein [Niabella sp.]HQX19311.1 ATP-binding cassette domain-containing protein [Niabella sp.]HQX40833.1 ATP-binding cassette domain-containing protein [Niabella sp.]